jgi:hypothetical protein
VSRLENLLPMRILNAHSGDLLGNGEMLVMRTTKYPAYSIRELISSQQTLGLHDLALAPCIHLGSMAFNHGLCLGRRQLTILTPRPLSLTSRGYVFRASA